MIDLCRLQGTPLSPIFLIAEVVPQDPAMHTSLEPVGGPSLPISYGSAESEEHAVRTPNWSVVTR